MTRDAANISSPPPVGLVGIGLMGTALAERLLAGGLPVVGYDTDPAKRAALASLNGVVVADAGGVFDRCERVVLSLPHSGVVRTLLEQVGPRLRAGQVIVDTTTGDPADAESLGSRLAVRGIRYLDATISGNSEQVRRGEVTLMAGGDAEAFERCRDLFALFARRAFHVGPVGRGSMMKLVTNLVLGLNRAALAEGLAFARAMGVDLPQALAVLRESMAYSRIMDAKGEKMIRADFEPQARLSQHLKDVRLILEAGGAAGAHLPLSHAHRVLLEAAEAAGLGELDNSAIIRAFGGLNGQPEGRGLKGATRERA